MDRCISSAKKQNCLPFFQVTGADVRTWRRNAKILLRSRRHTNSLHKMVHRHDFLRWDLLRDSGNRAGSHESERKRTPNSLSSNDRWVTGLFPYLNLEIVWPKANRCHSAKTPALQLRGVLLSEGKGAGEVEKQTKTVKHFIITAKLGNKSQGKFFITFYYYFFLFRFPGKMKKFFRFTSLNDSKW